MSAGAGRGMQALLTWEYEGGALVSVTRAAALHALRARISAATRRRDLLSCTLMPESYLAADSIVTALEAQLDGELRQERSAARCG